MKPVELSCGPKLRTDKASIRSSFIRMEAWKLWPVLLDHSPTLSLATAATAGPYELTAVRDAANETFVCAHDFPPSELLRMGEATSPGKMTRKPVWPSALKDTLVEKPTKPLAIMLQLLHYHADMPSVIEKIWSHYTRETVGLRTAMQAHGCRSLKAAQNTSALLTLGQLRQQTRS